MERVSKKENNIKDNYFLKNKNGEERSLSKLN